MQSGQMDCFREESETQLRFPSRQANEVAFENFDG